MKKFFKKITKKSPSKEQGAAGSPNLGGGEGAQASEASNLSYMYDVREKDLGRLHKAAWTGDINKVRQLAKKDHSPLDKENRTPLHLACARGHAAVVQELLEWKAKTNLGDNDANTPLMKAVQCQHADCVELLLEHHASVEVMDTEGNTCLHRAVQDGNYQIAEMLIKARASPDAKNKHGESILHAAVKTKQEEICRLLLRSGADVNIVDKEFRLPLMYACQDGSINLVKLLLEYQADTTSKDDKGWTADDYAVIKGHHACSTLIADHDRRYNLGSAASTPRTASFPPSSQVTPRERTGSVVLGIPAEDVAGEDSGDESASRISGHGGGAGDSWGDDTDISLAADDKGKDGSDIDDNIFDEEPPEARTKINLSKLVRNMSESEKEESVRSSHSPLPDQDGKQPRPSLDQQNSIVSQPSIEDSWAAADSPITPRRVSFKKDAELSEIRDISMQEEPEEVKQTPSGKTGGYTPTAIATSTPKVQLTAEKQREIQGEKNAFLEDFGLGDVDDISELSEHSAADPNKLKSSAAESDWDSTLASDQQITPRPGILKKWKQEAANSTLSAKMAAQPDEDSEWDSEVEDDAMPGNITTQEKDKESTFGAVTPRPVTEQQESDWDSTVEAVTPRQNAGLSFQQIGVDDIEEEKIEEEVKPPPLPRDYPSPTHPMEEIDGVTAVSAVKVQEDDEISGWDSDDGDLPSEPISPPSNFADRLQSSPLASPLKQSPHQSPKKDSPLGSPRKESPRGLSPLSTPRKSPKGPSPKASPKRKPSPKTSPRKSPRRQRDPSDSDEDSETISEWELERKKKKSLPPPPVASKFIDDFYDDDSDMPIKLSTRLSFEERERQKQWEEDGKAADALLKREAEEAIEAERKELEAQLSEDDQPEIDIKTTTVSNKPVEFQEPTISLDDSDDPGEEIKKESNNNITRGRTTTDTKPNEQTTPLTQPLQPVISMKEPQFSTHRELQQRLQIRGVQSSLPTTQAMQFGSSDPFEVDEDSYASDNPELPLDKPDTSSAYYPGLLSAGHFYNLERTPDDDVLSYTSTEFDNDSVAQPVIGKDLLMNLNISDPTTILKIQDHVRQTQKSFEQERNQRLILDNKHRLLSKEKHDLQKKIDAITSQKSTLEQNKLNLEAKIRSLEYGLTEEVEKRKNAETLLIKTKDQLVRKEEQYTKEIEAKQQAELNLRNLQLELRAAHNNVKELKDEVRELQHQAQHEKNARQLQEQINDEQQKLQLHQQREVIQSSSHHPVQRSNSGEIDEGAADNEKLRAELYALQMELERQRTRLKDENALLSSENDDYHQKIEELKNTIKLDEEAMVHLNMQHNIALSNIKTECNHISSNLDKERAAKEKAEAELGSISTRLTSTISEMERANQARNELEQSLQHEKEMWSQKLDKKDSELNELKQTNNQISQRIRSLEEKHHQMESELNVSNTSLMERTNQLQQYRFDVEKNKSSNGDSDFNFRLEKEQNSKLQMKIETLQEKLNQAQHESLNLKQQLEVMKQTASKENSTSSNEQMNTIVNNMRIENEKVKSALEDKNMALSESVTRLREELRNSDNRRSTIEQDLRKLTQDHTELIKKLSSTEANLTVAITAKEHLDFERGQLKLEVERLQQKYESAHEQTIESQARISDLVERTQRAEQNSMLSSQKLLNSSASIEANHKSKDEIKDELQKLQISYAKIEAELKHEKQRADMLQEDLLDSQKVRTSLEALCSNLKSTSSHLEDKLGSDNNEDYDDGPLETETANRTALEMETQETKGLWEQEVISRSKLGLRLAQLQRQNQESSSQLDEERRKLRKIANGKKTADAKYEEERARNTELEKEVTQLKAHLKAARKRLKDTDYTDSRISGLQSDYDKERLQMESTLSTAKRQLEDLQSKYDYEVEANEKLSSKNRQLQSELLKLRELEHSVNELESSKIKLESSYSKIKSQIDGSPVDNTDIRKEMEAKYRMELNRKLEDVNFYLEEQARARDKLDRSRGDNESKLMSERKRLDDENTNLRLKYEQALAAKESKEIESRRYRELYESEMKWRMRLNEQLQENTDKALNLKSKLVAEKHRSKLQASFGNFNFSAISGGSYDGSRVLGGDDVLSNKLRAELDRSIAKHLEAAPHDDVIPVVRSTDEAILNSSFAKSSAEYQRLLNRKFCV